jgi:hypothetical protein
VGDIIPKLNGSVEERVSERAFGDQMTLTRIAKLALIFSGLVVTPVSLVLFFNPATVAFLATYPLAGFTIASLVGTQFTAQWLAINLLIGSTLATASFLSATLVKGFKAIVASFIPQRVVSKTDIELASKDQREEMLGFKGPDSFDESLEENLKKATRLAVKPSFQSKIKPASHHLSTQKRDETSRLAYVARMQSIQDSATATKVASHNHLTMQHTLMPS